MRPHDAGDGAPFVDRFDDDRRAGTVVGSVSTAGVTRNGRDAEGVIGIDHGALRIRPLLESGWGRSQLSYGPYRRRDGLVLATLVLNGHNTSQSEGLPETFRKRMLQWLQGHGDPRLNLVRRAGQWLRHPRKARMVWRMRWWYRMARRLNPDLDENLSVGWSPDAAEASPSGGDRFVMHAALGANGELWAASGGELVPVARGIQNVPICYVVAVRARGAAYYIGSLPGAHGTATLPALRPVGLDTVADEPLLHASIHQSALGQIGFRVDTRVYGVQVADVPELAQWYGTAHAADELRGDGSLDGTAAAVGGEWHVVDGKVERTPDGSSAAGAAAVAVLRPESSSGLLHALVAIEDGSDAGLVWRYDDRGCCRLELGTSGCRLIHVQGDAATELAVAAALSAGEHSVQVIDDGSSAGVIVDGRRLFGDDDVPVASCPGAGVGFWATPGARLRSFEAHPAEVRLDGVLDLPDPWYPPGSEPAIRDDFLGAANADLDGRRTSTGDAVWRRELGKGRIVTDGRGAAVVDATVDRPNPGSTAYTVAWDDPRFADVEVEVTPPGSGRGEGHRGRAGVILWDDEHNSLTVSMYVDDSYDGASIAIFSHLDGFEEIYDAVWSMVGKKIDWGVPHRLRVAFDGNHLLCWIDDEAVLYRAVTDIYEERDPMRVHRVGIAVNWEWGDDTGSTFRDFVVRRRP